MKHILIDESGNRHGRLVVLKRDTTKQSTRAHWLCRCDCGNTTSVDGGYLRKKRVVSCGCKRRESLIERSTTHGMAGRDEKRSPEYHIWSQMIQRCTNPKNKNYHGYGGRGISVCTRWMKFEHFYEDMGKQPKGLTLDREDNNGPYSPENCRWVTPKEQARNTRFNRLLEFRGERLTLSEWSERTDINVSTIRGRLERNWTIEQALTTQPR